MDNKACSEKITQWRKKKWTVKEEKPSHEITMLEMLVSELRTAQARVEARRIHRGQLDSWVDA